MIFDPSDPLNESANRDARTSQHLNVAIAALWSSRILLPKLFDLEGLLLLIHKETPPHCAVLGHPGRRTGSRALLPSESGLNMCVWLCTVSSWSKATLSQASPEMKRAAAACVTFRTPLVHFSNLRHACFKRQGFHWTPLCMLAR